MIELDLIDRYTFATCPVNLKPSFKLSNKCFMEMVEKYSYGHEIPYPEVILETIHELKPQPGENIG